MTDDVSAPMRDRSLSFLVLVPLFKFILLSFGSMLNWVGYGGDVTLTAVKFIGFSDGK